MKNKMDQEYSFALRPASIEEAGLFYSNDEQDEALGTVGHLRLDFGHGFLPLRSTCYPHNDDQFDTLEFKILLREFLEAMQENGPLASLSSMEAYCQKHGGAITEDGQTYGYIWETEHYRFCLRCTPSPFEYQGHLYCYDLWQQQIQKNCPVGQVTYASGEQQTFTVVQHYLQTIREELPYRDTTGFRFETLTDDPKVKKAVDDILLDFAGEENPRRACNYGLTEAGNQALRDAADPDSPHTYAWFVLTDCNTLEEQIFRDLILEEAIQIYQASDCQEKRIGVTKDEVATVDLVRSLDGEQQFFEDHRKLRSFQNDPFIASAVEKLKQELEQTVETQGFELSSPWTESDLQYAWFENLPAGRYYLRELENEGYIPDTQMKTVYVQSGETTLVEWENTPITGQIQVTKTAADYNSMNGWPAGTPIPNTEFEIYNARTGNLVDTIRTDKNGVAVSRSLPLGRYKVVESKAADFYGLDKTPIEVEIKFAGQIVKTAMTNKSLYTNVSIQKTGYVEVMPGQSIRYDFANIANNSTASLTSFFWRDTLPTQAVRLDKIVTGTYNVPGNYKIVYQTNLSNGAWRTLADNLSTQQNYVLDASPAALGLAANECVTQFMVSFGVVPSNFRQVEAPQVTCTVLSGLTGGTKFTNTADVGGVYDGQWIMAVSRWVTTVYKPSQPLPRTGY